MKQNLNVKNTYNHSIFLTYFVHNTACVRVWNDAHVESPCRLPIQLLLLLPRLGIPDPDRLVVAPARENDTEVTIYELLYLSVPVLALPP